MTKCGDCIHFPTCKKYVDENECFPEVGGCEAFKNKADFVEVVRCSECKHLKIINKNGVYAKCKKTGYRFLLWAEDTGKHFCSFAERKKDAD